MSSFLNNIWFQVMYFYLNNLQNYTYTPVKSSLNRKYNFLHFIAKITLIQEIFGSFEFNGQNECLSVHPEIMWMVNVHFKGQCQGGKIN